MSDLATLLAKDAIRDLVLRYSRGIDRRDFALVRSLYAPGATDDHGAQFSGDAEAYVDWLETVVPHVETFTHHVANHLIAVDGETAEGEVYLVAYHRFRDAEGQCSALAKGLRYIDRYRKGAAGWQFAARRVLTDWEQAGPTLWPHGLPPAPDRDPSYSTLANALFARATL